jgi:sulfite exporter TauE/SafE
LGHAGIIGWGGFPVWATLLLGFVLGLRHALDPDHIAAVSTFVTEERDPLRSSLIGVSWGLGHTAALMVFGLALAVLHLAVSARVGQVLEFLVGCMLVFLGVNVLVRLGKGRVIHAHTHEHDGNVHAHLHFHLGDARHDHQHHALRWGGRPFVVGVMHGLAGTAAVMLLVVGAIPSLLLAVGALLVFGLGSIGGMVAMSLLMSASLAYAARRLQVLERVIRLAAGLFSLGFGVFLAWNVGLVQALLT